MNQQLVHGAEDVGLYLGKYTRAFDRIISGFTGVIGICLPGTEACKFRPSLTATLWNMVRFVKLFAVRAFQGLDFFHFACFALDAAVVGELASETVTLGATVTPPVGAVAPGEDGSAFATLVEWLTQGFVPDFIARIAAVGGSKRDQFSH